jgi:molybdopterin converting factor small subunit
MTVRLLAFASARDATGWSEFIWTGPEGATAGQIAQAILPGFRSRIPGMRIAINEVWADWDDALKEGQTLAFLPPVNGG